MGKVILTSLIKIKKNNSFKWKNNLSQPLKRQSGQFNCFTLKYNINQNTQVMSKV